MLTGTTFFGEPWKLISNENIEELSSAWVFANFVESINASCLMILWWIFIETGMSYVYLGHVICILITIPKFLNFLSCYNDLFNGVGQSEQN